MSEEIKKTGESRDEQGRFKPGFSGNPNGRPEDTEEEKAKKKALKKLIEDYKKELSEALPKISPALIEKASGGDVQAIKEINEVLGLHKNIVVGGDDEDNAILIKQILYGDNDPAQLPTKDIPTADIKSDSESEV